MSKGKEIGTVHKRTGYRCLTINRKKYRAARVAFFYMEGRWPIPTVDHKNRIRDDDRWDNLKEATYLDQAANRKNHGDGVYYRSDRKNCWRARTWESKDGKLVRVSIGNFATELEAVDAYQRYRNRIAHVD